MARYIKKYTNSGETQNALNNGQLNKPYVVYITSTSGIDYNTKDISIDYSSMPLTLEILSAGTIEWYELYDDKTINFKINNGSWNEVTSSTSITVNAGDKIEFKGDNSTYNSTAKFYESTAVFNVYGNIMSLIDSTGYTTADELTGSDTFNGFFESNTGLTDASNLILPATTLTDSSYSNMFYGCTNLTSAPSSLPATTLSNQCYYSMFNGCESLTTAPELPAPTLEESSYESMFEGCSSLNYIKCLATDISASACLDSWVSGVAESGTFVKDANMNDWDEYSNLPYGWTVIDA